jgi:membrane-associated phospholipid phosphatase
VTKKKIVPKKNANAFSRSVGRAGVVTRQPLFWGSALGLMATSSPQMKRGAGRAGAFYLLGAVIGNLAKPLFGREQPRHRRARKPQVLRGSFPSGHGAAEVALVFGAAQEVPVLLAPLGAAAAMAHWSLFLGGKHYTSDMAVGGAMGLAIAAAGARLWPPARIGGRSYNPVTFMTSTEVDGGNPDQP